LARAISPANIARLVENFTQWQAKRWAGARDRSSLFEAGGGEPRHQRTCGKSKVGSAGFSLCGTVRPARNHRLKPDATAAVRASWQRKTNISSGWIIGSTKTCALLAEFENEQLRFLALGAAESKGLCRAISRKG